MPSARSEAKTLFSRAGHECGLLPWARYLAPLRRTIPIGRQNTVSTTLRSLTLTCCSCRRTSFKRRSRPPVMRKSELKHFIVDAQSDVWVVYDKQGMRILGQRDFLDPGSRSAGCFPIFELYFDLELGRP